MSNTVEAKTITYPDGTIVQDITSEFDGARELILRRVIHTREQHVRDALIALGWTPPKGETK